MFNSKLFSVKACLLSLLCILWAYTPLCAFATADHVQDIAKVLNPQLATRIENALNDIEISKNLHIEVVLLPTLHGEPKETVTKAFFQQLERNAPEAAKHILLFFLVDQESVNLITSENLADVFTPKISNDIVKNISTKLKEKNYDEAVRVGIAGVMYFYTQNKSNVKSIAFGKIAMNSAMVILVIVLAFMFARKKAVSDSNPEN